MTLRAALIPVKPGHRAKDRLRPALGRRARMALTRAMLRDVLAVLLDSALFVSVTVVTRDRALRRLCRRLGVHAVSPPPGVRGLNAELAWAAARPEIAQTDRLLVLPGDVPGVRVSELFRLVLPPLPGGRRADDGTLDGDTRSVVGGRRGPAEQFGVRLVPSGDGGTNALLIAPPGSIPFRFGPGSAARHRAAAEAAGLHVESVPLPSLGVDIDRPQDLPTGGRIAGPRTRAVLAALENGRLRYRKGNRRHRHRRRTHEHIDRDRGETGP
jgi:2-phospho-L-lactate/phosphoenolpyruvate guanylyltransferase